MWRETDDEAGHDQGDADVLLCTSADMIVVGAARSLYNNQLRRQAIERRIMRAEATIRGFLWGANATQARVGAFTVERRGDEVVVTRHTIAAACQLPLWRHEMAQVGMFEAQ